MQKYDLVGVSTNVPIKTVYFLFKVIFHKSYKAKQSKAAKRIKRSEAAKRIKRSQAAKRSILSEAAKWQHLCMTTTRLTF